MTDLYWPEPAGRREIGVRVATYNVHGCVGMDRRYAPDRVAQVISELDVDVVALQEVDDRMPRFDGLGQFEYLCRATGLDGVPGPTLRDHRGHYGNAILSRFPIKAVRRIDLTVPRHEPRGALDVEITLPTGRMRVIATHLGLWARERKRQIARLADDFQQRPRDNRVPALLMGDFNEWLFMDGPRLRRLSDLFASRLAGPSFPSLCPLFPLDRIYAFPEPDRAQAEVHRSRTARIASDHLPVKAALTWSRPGRNSRT